MTVTVYETLDIVFSAIGVVSTIVLTAIIIIQTSNLNKKQQELEKQIENSQKKRELYSYRREIYRAVAIVNQIAKDTVYYFDTANVLTRSGAQIKEALETIEKFNRGDSLQLKQALSESDLVFSKEVAACLFNIRDMYNDIINASSELRLLDTILTEEEKKVEMPKKIVNNSKLIRSKAISIISEYRILLPYMKKEIALQTKDI